MNQTTVGPFLEDRDPNTSTFWNTIHFMQFLIYNTCSFKVLLKDFHILSHMRDHSKEIPRSFSDSVGEILVVVLVPYGMCSPMRELISHEGFTPVLLTVFN